MVDAAQNVSEVMLEFAPGSSELSVRWRHWFNMFNTAVVWLVWIIQINTLSR